MAVEIQQTDKGVMNLRNDSDGVVDQMVGGPGTPSTTAPRFYGDSYAKFPLAAGVDTGGGIAAWQTPSYAIIIGSLALDITTVATGTCNLEATTGANATVAGTTLINQDVHTATGTFNSGFKSVKLAASQWVTVSTGTGTSTGVVGNCYVNFTPA